MQQAITYYIALSLKNIIIFIQGTQGRGLLKIITIDLENIELSSLT